MKTITIDKSFIKTFEQEIQEKYLVSRGNLRKLTDDTIKLINAGTSKKLASRIAIKDKLKELNRPYFEKSLETGDSKYLSKVWKIFPVIGEDGKQYEEIMTFQEFKKRKDAALKNFKGKRRSMVTNSRRLIKIELLTLDYFK